jgi:phytanoyl-CoA hydroxylase
VGLWFALEDATIENGCLWAFWRAPAGLKSKFLAREGGGTRVEIIDNSPWPEDQAKPLEVEKGTLIVLHPLLPASQPREPFDKVATRLHASCD